MQKDSIHDCVIPNREIDCRQKGIGCGVFLQETAVQQCVWMKQSRVCQSRYIPKSGESKPQCSVSPTQNNTPFYLLSGSDCKESACNVGDLGLIPGSERSPGEGNGNPLQYSCLENPMHRGAWWATVHGVTKESDTTEQLTHTHTHVVCWRCTEEYWWTKLRVVLPLVMMGFEVGKTYQDFNYYMSSFISLKKS